MFRIECFCDDKNLAKTLWALQTMGVYNLTSVPVVNAKKQGDKVKANVSTGNRLDMLRRFIKKWNYTEMVPNDIRNFAEKHGLSVKSYSNILVAAQEAGILKRIGSEFRYKVTDQAPLARSKPKSKPKKVRKLKVVSASNPEEAA
jgi:hypothetical protein